MWKMMQTYKIGSGQGVLFKFTSHAVLLAIRGRGKSQSQNEYEQMSLGENR